MSDSDSDEEQYTVGQSTERLLILPSITFVNYQSMYKKSLSGKLPSPSKECQVRVLDGYEDSKHDRAS